MTGNVIVAQVKSLASFPINGAERAYRDLKWSTYNYLLSNPAPAYLFVCSLDDQAVYWRSLRDVDRCRLADEGEGPTVPMLQIFDLSNSGRSALQKSAEFERHWPDVERAAISSLMFYHALGPIYLACRREPNSRPLPSSVQLLINQHYEYNRLLQKFMLDSRKEFDDIRNYYEKAFSSISGRGKIAITAGFAKDLLETFIGDYLDAIKFCDFTIREKHRRYWDNKYPFIISQIDSFPPYFLDEDWYARYHFDEYESETSHIKLDLFLDVDDGTRHDFRYFMTNPLNDVKNR